MHQPSLRNATTALYEAHICGNIIKNPNNNTNSSIIPEFVGTLIMSLALLSNIGLIALIATL